MESQATLPARESAASKVNSTLGMVLFIGSWSMAFGTLFLCFAVLRHKNYESVGRAWPPEGIALPSMPLASVATLILIASSLLLRRAVKQGAAGDKACNRTWFAGLLAGAAFMGLQSWLWLDLMQAGRYASSGPYETLFYGLTWIHALHVAIGWLMLLWIQIGLSNGRYGSHRISTVNNAALFWHFVDVVWVVLFLGFFVF